MASGVRNAPPTAVVAGKHLGADQHGGQWMQRPGRLQVPVIGVEIDRIVGHIILVGVFGGQCQLVARYGQISQRPVAQIAQAQRAGGKRRRILGIDVIEIADQLVRRSQLPGQIDQVRVMIVIGRRHIAAEDAIHVKHVIVFQAQIAPALPDQPGGVVGLLVLTPANVADEAVVVELDALASHAQTQTGLA